MDRFGEQVKTMVTLKTVTKLVAATAVLALLAMCGIETHTPAPPETPVLVEMSIGSYATFPCAGSGATSVTFATISPIDKPGHLAPFVEIVPLKTARAMTADDGTPMKPDKKCREFGGFEGKKSTLFVDTLAALFARSSSKRTFSKIPCTDDCSGHSAGFRWAARQQLVTSTRCFESNSPSFNAGCYAYTLDHERDPSRDDQGRPIPQR